MKCVHSVVCDWCIFTSTHMYVYMYIDYLASFQLYFVFIINSSIVLVYILYNVLGKCTFVCIILYLATYYVWICTHVDCVES